MPSKRGTSSFIFWLCVGTGSGGGVNGGSMQMRCVWMVMIVQNLMVCDGWEVEDEWRHQLLIIGDVVQRKRR